MVVGALALAAILLSRKDSPPEKPRAVAPRPAVPATPAARTHDRPAIETLLAPLPFAERPGEDILRGTAQVDGPAPAAGSLGELRLTDSQRPIVEALLAQRDRVLDEIRASIDGRRPADDEADRLCARAQEAHASCMASIRATLLPDQAERFDALIRSGRWGGFTLTIPR